MPDPNPSLRLFLSADLAGSTAFKQQSRLEEWQEFFREFYRQLPAIVEKHWQRSMPGEPGLVPWKLIGDEIVFSMALTHHAQPSSAVGAFRDALAEYRRLVLRQSQAGLDVKCAGWTAGFPVGNIVVERLQGLGEDYVGPGMDIGFRLVKAASPRRMLLSVELAWLLTLPTVRSSRLFYVGAGLDLKGVARGSSYPCIWLDNFDKPSRLPPADKLGLEEERLRGARPPCCRADDLHRFCGAWLQHMGPPFVTPFILEDPVIGKPPDNYGRWLRQVTEEDSQGSQKTIQPAAGSKPVGREEIVSSLGAAIRPHKTHQPTPRPPHRRAPRRAK